MDSLTHIALGTCIGEAFFEKGFGKKAMIWGALAHSIPDIDFLASFWMDTPGALLAHRGFTHSILFAAIIIPIFSLVADKIHKPHNITFLKWVLFFSTAVFLHLFLDAFNNYGIGWFEPFSHYRFSFNIIYVADPFFSFPLFITFIALVIADKYKHKRKKWVFVGMSLSFLYLGYCVVNKFHADERFRQEVENQHIQPTDYFTTPAPLQNWLWYAVAVSDSGFTVAYFSLLDKKKKMNFHYFNSNQQLYTEVKDHESLQQLIRFSKGFYLIQKRNDSLIFNDLRFGQILGWRYPNNDFVFHYNLQHDANNKLIIQKGRMMNWNIDEFRFYLKRVAGN
jgi:inner membrane protein